MTRGLILAALAATVAGCGGDYILTAPDQLAAAGEETPVIVRLQRNDFFVLALAVDDAAMSFQTPGLPERGAYTDDLGYAGTLVPTPKDPGLYSLHVAHLDTYGDEVHARVPMYVWPKSRYAIAVDADSLPWRISSQSSDAVEAIAALASEAGIVYLTRRQVEEHAALHKKLRDEGYPDGPILLWQTQRWHIVRGLWGIPKLVVEKQLVSQLPELKERFANLQAGVTTQPLAAKAFAEAGLTPVIIGSGSVAEHLKPVRRQSWSDLAEQGL